MCSRAAVILAEAGGHWRPEQELGNSIADSSAREASKLLARDAADSARAAGHVFGRQAPPFFQRGTKLLVPPSEFSNPVKAPTPDETVASSRLPVTLRALRHRNFQLFFSGQLISLVGTWMQNIAQS